MSSFGLKKNNNTVISSGSSFFNYNSLDSNWTYSGGNIYNNNSGGNVGINTSTPQFQLDVNGQTIIRTPLVKIGVSAGLSNQQTQAIAIGYNAAESNQGTGSIAIGFVAGQTNQGALAIAIGSNAGNTGQGSSNTSIGFRAGNSGAAAGGVAIGPQAALCNTSGASTNWSVHIGELAGGTFHGRGAIGIGLRSGGTFQGGCNVAIGYNTAQFFQQPQAVAIGRSAGDISQSSLAVAIGTSAGSASQGTAAIAIGSSSGGANQGSNSICIGNSAVSTFQNSIVLNATGASLASDISNAFFVRTLDTSTGANNFLVYNPTSGKISYNTSSVKTFVIDHPINEDKYLVHGCLEGPEAGVYYRGEGEITNGESATITLPDYTCAFNNFTVHVSPSGSFNNLYASKVIDGKFTVFGDNGCFSWTVFGTRQQIDVEPLKSNTVVNGDGPYKYIL